MPRAATTVDVFNAVAERRRRDVLDVLGAEEVTVGELVDRLKVSQPRITQPQVSKHLKVLRDVDVVRCRNVGRHRVYRVNGAALRPLHDWVRGFEALWNARYDRLDDYLQELQRGGDA